MRGWIALALLATLPGHAAEAAQARDGTISGAVVSGTAGGGRLDGVRVQLIALRGDEAASAMETATDGGRFSFAVPADPETTYVVRAIADGVGYFSPPVLLSSALPTAEVEIVVYEATTEPPPLRIVSTEVTVRALDRAQSRLSLVREDVILNPADRTYVGNERGVTLRLPVPDGLVSAEGLSGDGSFTVDGGTLTTTAPLRPGETLVVTRYVVGYDRDRDAYRLRITAPLPTGGIAIRVPERFVAKLLPVGDTTRGEALEVEGERVLVVELKAADGLRPGLSAVADLQGLSGRRLANPLTERRGAAIAGVLALIVLTGGVALWHRVAPAVRP